MSRPRFHVPDVLPGVGADLEVEGSEAQHMLRVMRRGIGDEVILFDGSGRSAQATIISAGRRTAGLRVDRILTEEVEPSRFLTLFVALPRGGEAADLMRRAIEAGADAICPIRCARSVQKPHRRSREKQEERFQQAAIAAMKQCGLNLMPRYCEPRPLSDVKLVEGQSGVFGSTRGGSSPREMEQRWGGVPRDLAVLIGPEGGLTDEEEDCLTEAGFSALTLGSRILRVETAAIALLSFFSSAAEDEMNPHPGR